MKIVDFQCSDRALRATWQDHTETEFPFIWLRDNDPADFHPHTKERTFDLTTVSLTIKPLTCRLQANGLEIRWSGKNESSIYDTNWLHRHRPGNIRSDPATVEQTLWNSASMTNLPRVNASRCAQSKGVLMHALQTAKQLGILVIDGLEDNVKAGEKFGDLIGFKRETNFGVMFDVISKPDPNNLAYTALALPLHIDLTNQELIPGYQFLHCYINSTEGGESIFADGYKVCADLKERYPKYFDCLSTVEVPGRFYDETCDIRQHRPIIQQKSNGEFEQFVFNAHLVDVPDMPSNKLYDFYEAYQTLMMLMRQKEYVVHYQLRPGEMVMFDNHRVLHGRSAFDPGTGQRHLRGYYIDRNEVDSRIRILARDRI